MAAKKNKPERYSEIRNPKALRDYFVEHRFEAGIALKGTEVKSIRAGKAQIADAFGRIDKGEVYLHNLYIEEYAFGNRLNHDPRRARKLLLKKNEIRKISQEMAMGGRALVPLRMYFKEALVKVEVAICVGKKLYDKRQDVKEKEQTREIQKLLKRRL
jgi:SsrA-binding protein